MDTPHESPSREIENMLQPPAKPSKLSEKVTLDYSPPPNYLIDTWPGEYPQGHQWKQASKTSRSWWVPLWKDGDQTSQQEERRGKGNWNILYRHQRDCSWFNALCSTHIHDGFPDDFSCSIIGEKYSLQTTGCDSPKTLPELLGSSQPLHIG